ncbi:cuticle protein 2-like [Artemia franciscana]|uniref:cuticle protein 2-like n=1 Tax=Artemia franciscana TaxID=6661 RepID=UPI0032DAFB2B
MAFLLAVVYATLACSYAAPSNYGYAPAAGQSAYAPAPSYGGPGPMAATMTAMKDTAAIMEQLPVAQPPPRDYQFNYNINDEMSGSLHQRVEEQKNGVITGSFAYTAPDGKLMTVKYVADEKGYRPEISEAQAPIMKTNTASTYTMNLPDAPEQVQVSITQQEMDAYRTKAGEMEKAAAYGTFQQNSPQTHMTYQQSAPQAPMMYGSYGASAPAAPAMMPMQAPVIQPASAQAQGPQKTMPIRY